MPRRDLGGWQRQPNDQTPLGVADHDSRRGEDGHTAQPIGPVVLDTACGRQLGRGDGPQLVGRETQGGRFVRGIHGKGRRR